MDNSFYSRAGQGFAGQEARIATLEQQLSTGSKVPTAGTDPAAYIGNQADQATVRRLDALNAGQVNLQQNLGTATMAMDQATSALDHIQSIALQAANGTTSNQDFQALSQQVGEGLQQILSLANTQGSNGNYVFAGTARQTQPFVTDAAGGVSYMGNDGTSAVEISPGVTVNAALSGDVFTNARSGNGFASVTASASNTGSGTVMATGVSDAAAAAAFQSGSTPVTLAFSSSANGAVSYTATSGSSTIGSGPVNTANGASTTITLDGVELTVAGQPKAGDSFTMAPSRPQSIFDLVKQIQTALASPGTTPAVRAQTRQLIGNSLATIVQYQHRLAGASAKAGVVLQATSAAATSNARASTSAKENASALVSANTPQVLSELQNRSSALQAAMKAFSVASQLNLFKYL
ncbi:hypothetical protein U879_11790 [Defluviimonas sp. 20V17]|uniref:Flagellar hook-associated protein 3 n=1 Tax=Allgaiera indica TaxID=765699 RepID=A0AAN4ZYF9_9RHOB|nr:flagellar hook-associated protein FlgL [Allgaiera indica]KDB03493.1 hypothetical protein U879_11790 [Defluviimonas sp. 20V17]GHD98108.1 flagellar hook-associated protein 3 [Allgaiera indica]SDW53744.1 flagellar hook-associated protein 3 FlgL [Allgaiera indica]